MKQQTNNVDFDITLRAYTNCICPTDKLTPQCVSQIDSCGGWFIESETTLLEADRVSRALDQSFYGIKIKKGEENRCGGGGTREGMP